MNMRDQIKKVVIRHFQAVKDDKKTFGHALIIGPTGSGKTYTIKNEIKRLIEQSHIDVPFVDIDATYLTREGWQGYSLSEAIACKEMDPEKLRHAIVYIDEFDKINIHADTQGHARGIQHTLLNWLADDARMLLRKSHCNAVKNVSTDQITFIFSGTFQSLFTEEEKKPIGFAQATQDKKASQITHEKIINYGFVKELIYRVPYLITVSPYTKAELKRIMDENEHVNTAMNTFNININEKAFIDFIHQHDAGARAITLYLAQKDLENDTKTLVVEENKDVYKKRNPSKNIHYPHYKYIEQWTLQLIKEEKFSQAISFIQDNQFILRGQSTLVS